MEAGTRADPAPPTVTVVLPSALLALFPGSVSPVTVEAESVGAMIDALNARWPGMGDRLRDSRPSIRRHINVFVAGERATLSTPLAANSRIYVLTAMSGG